MGKTRKFRKIFFDDSVGSALCYHPDYFGAFILRLRPHKTSDQYGKGSIRGQETPNFCPRILNFQEKFGGMFFSKIRGYLKLGILLPSNFTNNGLFYENSGVFAICCFCPQISLK
jgi:hypothetical protein